MKSLKLILIAILSLSSVYANEVNTVKVWDGAVASCKSKKDALRFKSGAYKFFTTSAEISESSTLVLPFILQFLNCEEVNGEFKMVSSLPYSGYTYTFGNVVAENSVSEVRVKAYRDGHYKVLMDQVVQNTKVTSLKFDEDLSKVLTNEEALELEDKGQVKISVDFFILKQVNTVSNTGSDFNRNIPFGSFRVHVLLKKNQDQIKASLIK